MVSGWVKRQLKKYKESRLLREMVRKVSLKINQLPAITFLEGRLPRTMLDELNAHVDEHREKIEDFHKI